MNNNKETEKTYYIQYNVGKVKYLLNFHDGEKTHSDGSPFYDIRCFSNKKKLQTFEKTLIGGGYKEKTGWS